MNEVLAQMRKARLRPQRLLLPLAYFENPQDLPRAIFLRRCLTEDFEELRRVTVRAPSANVEDLAEHGTVEATWRESDGRFSVLLRLSDGSPAWAHRRSNDDRLTVELAGRDRGSLDGHADALAEALADDEPPDERLCVTFWSGSGGGLVGRGSRRRRLAAPGFPEVVENYPAAVGGQLQRLAELTPEPDLMGRLLLWHGPPGTGKTWALRALSQEWRGWCDIHYITDPERFLGADSGYMLSVLLDDEEDEGAERWRLVVLEDAGELIAVDARLATGGAFARLMNIVDGLLGQGTRTLVLVTTNEPLDKLHPAVTRPGRALAEIAFTTLSEAEAQAWLAARDAEARASGAMTIAELYAIRARSDAEASEARR